LEPSIGAHDASISWPGAADPAPLIVPIRPAEWRRKRAGWNRRGVGGDRTCVRDQREGGRDSLLPTQTKGIRWPSLSFASATLPRDRASSPTRKVRTGSPTDRIASGASCRCWGRSTGWRVV